MQQQDIAARTNRLEKPKKAIVAARASQNSSESEPRVQICIWRNIKRGWVAGWVRAAHISFPNSLEPSRVPTRSAACFGSRLNCYPLVITPQPYHHLFSFEHPQRAGNNINNIIYYYLRLWATQLLSDITHQDFSLYSPQDAFKLKWFGFLLTAGGEGISDFFNLVFKVWLVLWWAVLYFYIKNTNHNKEQWEIFQQLVAPCCLSQRMQWWQFIPSARRCLSAAVYIVTQRSPLLIPEDVHWSEMHATDSECTAVDGRWCLAAEQRAQMKKRFALIGAKCLQECNRSSRRGRRMTIQSLMRQGDCLQLLLNFCLSLKC